MFDSGPKSALENGSFLYSSASGSSVYNQFVEPDFGGKQKLALFLGK